MHSISFYKPVTTALYLATSYLFCRPNNSRECRRWLKCLEAAFGIWAETRKQIGEVFGKAIAPQETIQHEMALLQVIFSSNSWNIFLYIQDKDWTGRFTQKAAQMMDTGNQVNNVCIESRLHFHSLKVAAPEIAMSLPRQINSWRCSGVRSDPSLMCALIFMGWDSFPGVSGFTINMKRCING